jgi:hypothetical protein
MLHEILVMLAVIWVIDGVALVFTPRTMIDLLRDYLD